MFTVSRFCFVLSVLVSVTGWNVSDAQSDNPRVPPKADGLNNKHLGFLTQNCADCHEGESGEGGFDVTALGLKLDDPAQFTKWERIHDRIAAGEMPPEDADQPDQELSRKFVASIGKHLEAVHQKKKSTVLRRLNRQEYQNTLNDLFGVNLQLAELLPEDGRSHEFDTVGSALNLSMVHLQKYMEAARLILDESIAKTTLQPKVEKIEGSYDNTREGNEFIGKIWKKLPDGSVVRFAGGGYPSGMIRSTNLRRAGSYRVKVTGYAYQSQVPISFSVGGTTFKRGAVKPTYGYFTFRPGKPQTVEFQTRIEKNYMIQIEPFGIDDPQRYQRKSIDGYEGPGLAIQSVVLEGPLLEQFPSKGHQLVFDGIRRVEVEPRDPRQKSKPWYKPKFEIQSSQEATEAEQSLLRVAGAAFRRPVSSEDIQTYLQLFHSRRKSGAGFEEALRQSIVAILCSPRFLFLEESEGKLDGYSIASRLSYFLQRTAPDSELLQLATNGKLQDLQVIRQQVDRLVSSPHFERFVNDFADSWLNLREMDFTTPDTSLFPEYDEYLRYSMPLETKAFIRELFRSNLPVQNLIQSDFVMVNERLARHYGIEGVTGTKIRKVPVPDGVPRGGVLTQASVLKVSANGTNSSPVVRGVFVMERILGESPLPPPPGVPGVEPDIRGATTLRQLLDKHRDLTQCQSCHQAIDPPGFALEFFNPIGGFREKYRSLGEGEKVRLKVKGRNVRYRIGPVVDGSGELKSGEKFDDFLQFRNLLAKKKLALAKAFTKKLLTFATGRELGFSDRAEVERIAKSVEQNGYRVADLLDAVVTSKIFLTK